MRACPILIAVLLLSACSNDGLTRDFNLSRDSGPETATSLRMPLSAPPMLTERPERPGALAPNRIGDAADQAAGSPGQQALVEAAGPPAEADVRTSINENSGMAYPAPGFVDQLLNWTPPPGYKPVFTQQSSGSWLSRLF